MKRVVTYQAPSGAKIDVCENCEAVLDGYWPRDKSGEYCTVSHGLHDGECSICSGDAAGWLARAIRRRRGWSVDILAEEVGVAPATINNWEQIRTRVSRPALKSLMALIPQYRCQCGEWTGQMCDWTGPTRDMVVVEYMPRHLRESHIAARNSGVYPHNGSIRVAVERGCAEMAIEDDPEWTSIVSGVNVGDYAEIDE